jgi:hypothetical protein
MFDSLNYLIVTNLAVVAIVEILNVWYNYLIKPKNIEFEEKGIYLCVCVGRDLSSRSVHDNITYKKTYGIYK